MIERPLVMKFGGTSVADEGALRRLVEHVAAARRKGAAPVVVVSALAGVTNELLRAASMAAEGDAAAEPILAALRRRHLELTVLVAGALRDSVARAVDEQFDELSAVIRAIVTLKDASPRAMDAIAAAGELLSSRIVHAALTAAGVPAAWADPRRLVITNEDYTQAAPLFDHIAEAIPRELGPVLAAGGVPVTAGYVGATREGVTTTLGRGGSDYSAAIVGAALHASEIQIWTDVDGMLTADPRIVAAPRVVPVLSFGEASELAYFGAKVLHPSTIVPAVSRNIPVRILNSRRAAAPGTLIASGGSHDAGEGEEAEHRGLAALACKRNVTVVDITSTRMLMAYGYLRRVFEVFERHRTAVDVVTTSEVSVSVTVDDARHLPQIVAALEAVAEVTDESNMAIVCAVGDGLQNDPSFVGHLLEAVGSVPIRMLSQAAARRNITLVINEKDLETVLRRVHDRFCASVMT